MYLYVPEASCDEETQTIPPFLYGSLFALLGLEILAMISESLIFSVSARGTISNPKRRKVLPCALLFRVVIFVLEVFMAIICIVAVFDPGTINQLACIEQQQNALNFARGVTITLLVVLFIYLVGFLGYLDPIGCCTPSLLQEMDVLNDYEDFEDSDADGFKYSIRAGHDIERGRGKKMPELYRNGAHLQLYRKFATLCCCLNVGGNQSRAHALQELTRALHSIFHDLDVVPTDILAGIVLLSKSQKMLKNSGECLFSDFRKVGGLDRKWPTWQHLRLFAVCVTVYSVEP